MSAYYMPDIVLVIRQYCLPCAANVFWREGETIGRISKTYRILDGVKL